MSCPRTAGLLVMPAELGPHGRQQLVGELVVAPRGEAAEERFGDGRYRCAGLDCGQHRPPALTRVGNPTGEPGEFGVGVQGGSGEVEQLRTDDAAPPPQLGDGGDVEVVLEMARVAEGRGFGVDVTDRVGGADVGPGQQ